MERRKLNGLAYSESCIEHIYAELYRVPEQIRKGFFKLKVMELFLVLSGIDVHKNEVTQYAFPKSQVQLANSVAGLIMQQLCMRDQHKRVEGNLHPFVHGKGTQNVDDGRS